MVTIMCNDKEFQNETLVTTMEYKGYNIEIWNDDYGQCYFFKFLDKKGRPHEHSCGTYNLNYEQEVKDYIDGEVYDGTLEENMRKRFNWGRKINCSHVKSVYTNVFAKMLVLKKSGSKEIELTDDQIISLIQKEVKELKEEMSYRKEEDARWRELDREVYEISQWLPKELTEEEVMAIINEIISNEQNPVKGKIIGATVKRVGSQFDKSKIAGLVDRVMNGE